MFYLSGRGTTGNARTKAEDEFGWYLGAQEKIEDKIYNYSRRIVRTPTINCRNVVVATPEKKLSSMSSGNSQTDSEDPESHGLDEDFTTRTANGPDDSTLLEHIEMRSFRRDEDIDLDMIERDTDCPCISSIISSNDRKHFLNIENEWENVNCETICYTPERLVQCQEYRILTHSPIFLAIPRDTLTGQGDTGPRRYHGYRRRHADITDALDKPLVNRPRLNFRNGIGSKKNLENHGETDSRRTRVTCNRKNFVNLENPDESSVTSTCGKCDDSREKSTKMTTSPLSRDVSDIRSSDSSANARGDIRTPISLCDELVDTSRNLVNDEKSRIRDTSATNDVVTIVKCTTMNPVRSTVVPEKNPIGETTSGRDRLTRLALAIKPQAVVRPIVDDTESSMIKLRDKVERLQVTSRNIFKDIDCLRADFKYNERKVDDLTDGTVTLRQNINEIRYLDDLLKLLDGELERISPKNWPFVFGYSEHRTDDMNLIV